MKEKIHLWILVVALVFLGACAKKDTKLPAVSGPEIKGPIAFHNMSSKEDQAEFYHIYPEDNILEITWGGATEEDWEPISYELVSFNESDVHVEFIYLDDENEEVEKNFEFLSDSVAKDEKNQRYER